MSTETQEQEPRRLHSIRRSARSLDVSDWKVRQLVKQGVLDTRQIGGRVLITDESLNRLAEHGAP